MLSNVPRAAGLLFWFFVGPLLAQPADRESEIQKYIHTFSGPSSVQQAKECQTLQWQGLSDPRIFDPIEKSLMEEYQNMVFSNNKNVDHYVVDRLSWYTRCLAASGNPKYLPTLKMVVERNLEPKISKNAERALLELPRYTEWNPIISSGQGGLPGLPGHHARLINMIRSKDYELKRLGAKRIHFEHVYTVEVLGALDEEIKATYMHVSSDRMQQDCIAWMMKALAGSRQQEYKTTLTEITKTAPDPKVRKYAKRFLKYYKPVSPSGGFDRSLVE